jgi:DNA ligase-1
MVAIHKALRYILTVNEKQMTLGADWSGQCVDGWFASEKLDGCRAYWDGSRFWTRGGKVIDAPEWFTEGLPACHLDGEIWAGRGGFNAARNAVNFGRFNSGIRFAVFDAPNASGNWSERIASISLVSSNAFVVKCAVVSSRKEMIADMQRIQACGGEGLIVRNPAIRFYERGRTSNILKVKRLLNEDWNSIF